MNCFITQTQVAARLKVSNLTLKRRLSTHGLKPDAALIERSRFHRASALWDLSRMDEIRTAVLPKRAVRVPAIIPTIL